MRPLAPELVGVLVVAHALPRFLGCLGIYDSWVLNLGCPCPKKTIQVTLTLITPRGETTSRTTGRTWTRGTGCKKRDRETVLACEKRNKTTIK